MKGRLTFSVALLIVWIGATWQLVDLSNQLEAMKTIVMSLAGFGVLCTTTLTIWNAWETSKNFSEKINFDKIENAFRFTERWDSNSLKEARDLTRKIKKDKPNMSDVDLFEKIYGCEATARSVITMFNFWEEIYRSILAGRVNEQILKGFFGEVYCDVYERFTVWREDTKKKGNYTEAVKSWDALYKMWKCFV